MKTIYTQQDWANDTTFKAAPGQEIEETIYYEMLDRMPLYSLPRCDETEGYVAGFLVSEPYDFDPATGRTRYSAFGRRDGKFFFIGYLARGK